MAASIAAHSSASSVIADQDIENFFENSLNDIAGQLSNGVRSPVIAFDKLQAFGISGIPYWQGYIQSVSQRRSMFDVLIYTRGMLNIRFTHQVDLFANTVTLHPVNGVPESGQMILNDVGPSAAVAVTEPTCSTAIANMYAVNGVAGPSNKPGEDIQAPVKDKVPRPPNSFIIYRQEWHPKIVKQHPGVHNNEICKLPTRPGLSEY